MTTPVTAETALRPEDVEQLRLLAIFHYVVAGIVLILAVAFDAWTRKRAAK